MQILVTLFFFAMWINGMVHAVTNSQWLLFVFDLILPPVGVVHGMLGLVGWVA